MIDAIEISGSALRANQSWLDVISNNVANMQTAGFKKASVQFANLIQSGANSVGNETSGAGIRVAAQVNSFATGSMRATNQPLDVAIAGDGFFQVMLPGGEIGLSRVGSFRLGEDGRLKTRSGLHLLDDIRVSPDIAEIEIGQDGRVRGKVANTNEIVELGEMSLARVASPDYLRNAGDGIFIATEQSGEIVTYKPGERGAGSLLQSHLEMSNVDLVEEMSNLVVAQRAYQLNARVLQTSDQILETINNLRR